MAVLPPPAPGCEACAARDAVIAEQGQLLEEQAGAIGELRADLVALAEEVREVRELRRRLGRNSGFSELLALASGSGSRCLFPPASMSDRVDDQVEVGVVEAGDGLAGHRTGAGEMWSMQDLAYEVSSPQAVFEAWVKSLEYCSNIQSREFRTTGVAFRNNCWVQIFVRIMPRR